MVESMDRHVRQNIRAQEVMARERARQERRKNALPPFLMVRSGLINSLLLPLGAAIGCATSLVNEQKDAFSNETNWQMILWLVAFGITAVFALFRIDKKRQEITRDFEKMQREFNIYMKRRDYELDSSEMGQHKKRMPISIGHIVRYNPGIFDKVISAPESVKDSYVRSCIVDSYLKEHPNDAPKVIEKIEPDEINPRVYNRALRYAKRLKAAEKQK